MKSSTLREKLHYLINNSSEEELREVYLLLENDYTEEFKVSLHEEYADYQQHSEVISKEELIKKIDKLLYEK